MTIYYIGFSALLWAVSLLLGLLLWYMEQRRQIPGLVRVWRESQGLTQEAGAEALSNLLKGKFPKHRKPKDFDPRTIQRWEAGKNLPNLQTVFMVKQALSGANYIQMQQTLANGTQSYGALVRLDEATPADLDRLVYESHERSYKKGLISEEDWRAYKTAYEGETPRKRGRPRKKRRPRKK